MSDIQRDVKNDYERAIKTKQQCKVSILYRPNDIHIAQHVAKALTKNSITCVIDRKITNKVFSAREPLQKHIAELTEQSENILLILSKDSIEDSSHLLEAVLTLNQSKTKDDLTLRVLLHGVDGNKTNYLRDFLASVPNRNLDFNKNEWEKDLLTYLTGESQPDGRTEGKMYDLYIVYESDEDFEMAKRIERVLRENSLNVLTQLNPEAIPAGRPKFDSVVKCVQKSAKTIIILTKKSKESHWIIELDQAIEQSMKSGYLTLRPIVNNVKDDELEIMKRGFLSAVPHFRLDFDETNWQTKLMENITREVQLPDILPLEGSMSHGLVFSHYVGFLSYVLPILRQKIQTIQIFRDNPRRVSRKYHILLPKSCKVPGNLQSYDSVNKIRIEQEVVIPFKEPHAGKLRIFSLTIYKITKKTESGDESYYFFADCPYILNSMFVMKTKGLKGVDMRHQLSQLHRILADVINHADNKECFGTVKLLTYDEKEESLESTIYCAVKNSIEEEIKEDKENKEISGIVEKECLGKSDIEAGHEFSKEIRIATDGMTTVEYEVAINYSEDSIPDSEVAHELQNFFKSKNITVYTEIGTERELSIRPARWQFFVLSKQSVTRSNTLIHRCCCVLYEALKENALNVVLILVDIEPKYLPRYIKWVIVVKSSESRYCEKLLKTMKGGVVRMEHRLPLGDVATGLAWAYVINYLQITLLGEDLMSRIKKLLKEEKIECGCILKMFPILPKSCTVEMSLKDKANKDKGEDKSKVVNYIGNLDPVVANTGCQLGRPFYLHVFKLTDTAEKKSVCFIAEYFTPGNCLHEMAYRYPFAGLQREDMVTQGKQTVDLVQDILLIPTVQSKLGDMSNFVKIIYYDDEHVSLMSTLNEHILEKMDEHTVVFAEEK